MHEKKSQFDFGPSDLWKFHSLNRISMPHLFWPLDWQVIASACLASEQRRVRVAVRLVHSKPQLSNLERGHVGFKFWNPAAAPISTGHFSMSYFSDFRFSCLS